MKKLLSFVLAITLTLSMSVTAFAVESPDEDCIIKTWKTESGETVTGVITRGSEDVEVVRMNPESGNYVYGIITHASTADNVSEASSESVVSDYFYMQIINNDGTVASKYQIVLRGTVTETGSKITNLGINYVSGTRCAQDWSVNGNTAYVAITHPALGMLEGWFILGEDGVFYVL